LLFGKKISSSYIRVGDIIGDISGLYYIVLGRNRHSFMGYKLEIGDDLKLDVVNIPNERQMLRLINYNNTGNKIRWIGYAAQHYGYHGPSISWDEGIKKWDFLWNVKYIDEIRDERIVESESSESSIDEPLQCSMNPSSSTEYSSIPSKIQSSIDSKKNECVVCLSNNINTISRPCMHAAMCVSCSKKCITCPMCRTEITLIETIFIA